MSNNYFDNLHDEVKAYFQILSSEIPEFLYEYVEVPELRRLNGIGLSCGTDYTKLYRNRYFYSRLDHSVGVALILWHFTKDKKQTIAGLLHDISTPAFSHVIDFMKGDAKTQETTEIATGEMIKKSTNLVRLLQKNDINIEEVDDYKLYPIADNPSPQLSSDRLEYTFSSGLTMGDNRWNLNQIRKVYSDIRILTNESHLPELGFNNLVSAEIFVNSSARLGTLFLSNENKLTLQLLADIIKIMISNKVLTESDLYTFSEREIIQKIEGCGDSSLQAIFEYFKSMTSVKRSDREIKDAYCISVDVKRRFINPLVCINGSINRVNRVSSIANSLIEEVIHFEDSKYAYIDIEPFR